MDEVNGGVRISPLVRQYSLTMSREMPEEPLSQAVGSVVEKIDDETRYKQRLAEWNEWLQVEESSSEEDLILLEKQRKELVQTWQNFKFLFQTDGGSVQAPDSIPTITTLREAVMNTQNTWLSKRSGGLREAKSRFVDFLGTMNDHSYLFSFIPSGDKYFSLLAGVVSTVVKASANHRKIAEGFSMALVETCSDLRFVTRTVKIADNLEIRRLVVELYVGIFKLFCQAMNWFKKSKIRLLSSLNRNFYYNTVEDLVKSIKKTVQRVKDESQLIEQGRVARIEGRVDLIYLRCVGNESRNDDIATLAGKLERAKEILGYSSVQALVSVEERVMQKQSSRVQYLDTPEQFESVSVSECQSECQSEEVEDGADSVSEGSADELCSRYEIEKLSRPMAVHLEDGREDISFGVLAASSTILPQEVLTQMQIWISAPESRMMWVVGEPVAIYGSGLSLAAMRLCSASIQAGIPCVSFFCSQRHSFESASDMSHCEAGLVALLYSVIAQLAHLLPTEFTAPNNLNKPHFSLLDGSMKSVPVALQLIQALLIHAPPSLIWVLDGLQLTESDETITHLIAFINILHDEKHNRISKVCFTTDGNSLSLMTTLDVFERVDASRMAQRIPGHPLRGGSDVSELGHAAWGGVPDPSSKWW